MANKEIGLRVALAAALGFSGAAGAVFAGKAILDQASRQRVGAASEYPEGTVMPSEQAFRELVTPTLIPTATPKPADTATPFPSPTEKAKPTIAITPTLPPTPEPSPTPKPTETPNPIENPLPKYGAFMGDLRNEKTAVKGVLMLAQIPKKSEGQQIVIYFQEGDRTGTTYGAYPLELVSIQGNNFKAETDNGPRWSKGLYVVEAEWNPDTQAIKGRLIRNAKGQLPEIIRTFEVSFLGTGKAKVLEAVKRTKTAVRGGDWTRVNIDEFEREITLP